MAMEVHVFFCGTLPSRAALETAMKELGFPLSIKPVTGSLEQQRGFMPMRLGREKTGVEFHVFNGRSAIEDLEAEVDPSFDRVASFRWAGDETEMVCGLCAAAALAKLTNGVVLEEQEGKVLAPDEAVAMARENGEGLIPEAPAGPGSSPPAPPIHVFFRGELPSKAELAAAMKRLSYALILKDCEGSLEDQRGSMAIKLGPQETGVEFNVLNGRSAVVELAEDIDPGLDRVASFHFGARRTEVFGCPERRGSTRQAHERHHAA